MRALVLVLLVACGSEDDSCTAAGHCTLREAGEAAGLHVGVAAAPTEERATSIIVREFDALSPEGELLWKIVHPERDRWDFEAADAILTFADEHAMTTTVSHFVWDQEVPIDGTPEWVSAIDDAAELRAVLREHMTTLAERYGDRIDRWITVNEPLEYYTGTTLYENHFHAVLGPDYIEEIFRIADETAPQSQHWLNEILLENNGAKADTLLALVTRLVEHGTPIDGVGIQGHLFSGDPDVDIVARTMRGIAALGLEVAITELDAPEPARNPDRATVQGARMVTMIDQCLAVPECKSVTFWGLHDGVSWLNWFYAPNTAPLLYDAELEPKTQYFAVRDALSRGRP